MPLRSWKQLLMLAFICSIILYASPASADDAFKDMAGEIGEVNSKTIRLRFLAIVPPSPNPLRDGRSAPYKDPTVIPFSGWQFFSPEGESQPWLKRSALCTRLSGQYTDYRHMKHHRLMDYWSVSGDMTDAIARSNGRGAERLFRRALSFTSGGGSQNGYYASRNYYAFNDPKQLPNKVSYRYSVSGQTERIARFKLGDPLPQDLPMCKITYIGEVRTDTDQYEKHITNKKRPADFKPTFEVAAQMDWDAEEWNYVFHWVPVGKLAERRVTYTIPDVADIYIYTNMKEAEIRELQITRKLNLIEYTKPFKTDVIKQHWDTEKKQEKISITDEHVFGEPKTLELVVEGGDGPCLVDLDQAKAYAIPEGIEGVELAKYQEEKQIDLRVLINTDNHSAVRTVACSAYGLPKKYWDATPQACVRHFDDIRNGTVAEVPSRRTALWDKKTYAEQLDRVFLATTSDGSMVIYRIDRLDLSPDAGPAKATITVRKVVSHKQ